MISRQVATVVFLGVFTVSSQVVLAGQAAPGDPTNLKDLVAKAKASNRTVTLSRT